MKTKTRKIFRQGDVLIERVATIPATAAPVAKAGHDRISLAHGEATGHHHSLEIDAADWWKDGADQFLDVPNRCQVTHQEHAPIDLAPGKYRVSRQREYSPEAIRNVAD